MRRALPLLILAVLPAAASAQAPTAAPVGAAMQVRLQNVGHATRAIAFTGRSFRVRGAVEPYVAGQQVRVRFFRGGREIGTKTVPIQALGNGNGFFVTSMSTKVVGRIRVSVTHEATPEMAALSGKAGPVEVIRGSASIGERSRTVRVMQSVLDDLGYVVGRRGYYDARTARAVLAFRKMSGLPRITSATYVFMRRLRNGGGVFKVRYPGDGRHAEGDLTHQVLALIDKGKVERIYPISSGKPSTPTVLGRFKVYRREPGINSHEMVDSSYFIGGYAIHGFADVPTHPASHGCLRAPIPDARAIYDWLDFGDRVDVYYRSGKHRSGRPGAKVGP